MIGNNAVSWHSYEFKCKFGRSGVCTGEDGTVDATAVITAGFPLLVTEWAPTSPLPDGYTAAMMGWADAQPLGAVSLFPFCWCVCLTFCTPLRLCVFVCLCVDVSSYWCASPIALYFSNARPTGTQGRTSTTYWPTTLTGAVPNRLHGGRHTERGDRERLTTRGGIRTS